MHAAAQAGAHLRHGVPFPQGGVPALQAVLVDCDAVGHADLICARVLLANGGACSQRYKSGRQQAGRSGAAALQGRPRFACCPASCRYMQAVLKLRAGVRACRVDGVEDAGRAELRAQRLAFPVHLLSGQQREHAGLQGGSAVGARALGRRSMALAATRVSQQQAMQLQPSRANGEHISSQHSREPGKPCPAQGWPAAAAARSGSCPKLQVQAP